jgi:hypothetical protein
LGDPRTRSMSHFLSHDPHAGETFCADEGFRFALPRLTPVILTCREDGLQGPSCARWDQLPPTTSRVWSIC